MGGGRIFFESQDSETEGFGVVGCVFRGVKLALKHSCGKASLRL